MNSTFGIVDADVGRDEDGTDMGFGTM
jgi:hypothetical protein